MDSLEFWVQLGKREPDDHKTTHALAIFAKEYVAHDSRKIENYAEFKENDMEETN